MFDRLKAAGRALAGKVQQPQPQSQLAKGGNEKPNPYERSGFSGKQKRTPREIYLEGGPVAEATDAYALYTLSAGYELMCEEGDERLKELVQEWIDQPYVDFESILYQGIIDSVLNKTAYQELVPVSYRALSRWGISTVVPRDATTFKTIYNKYGVVLRYEQTVGDQFKKEVIQFKPEQILTLSLFPVPGEVEGTSIFQRAYDDIMRDVDVVDSNTTAIHRHGHPKLHIPVGNDENPSTPEQRKDIAREFENLASKNDFVTSHVVGIENIDTGGVGNVDTYSNFTLQRLACAMGVPEEILGLGRGSTEATANVRLRTFYDKIGSIQKRVERAYNRQLIDRITGVPGAVWIKFNPVDKGDFLVKAQAISSLRSGFDTEGIADNKWSREYLGIPPAEDTDLPDIPEEETPTPTPGDANKQPDEVQEVV